MKLIQLLAVVIALVSLSSCASTKNKECSTCCSADKGAACDMKNAPAKKK